MISTPWCWWWYMWARGGVGVYIHMGTHIPTIPHTHAVGGIYEGMAWRRGRGGVYMWTHAHDGYI